MMHGQRNIKLFNDEIKIFSHNYVYATLLLHVSSLLLLHHNGMSHVKIFDCFYWVFVIKNLASQLIFLIFNPSSYAKLSVMI